MLTLYIFSIIIMPNNRNGFMSINANDFLNNKLNKKLSDFTRFVYVLMLSGALIATPQSVLLLRSAYQKAGMEKQAGKTLNWSKYKDSGLFNEYGIQSNDNKQTDLYTGCALGVMALLAGVGGISGLRALRKDKER